MKRKLIALFCLAALVLSAAGCAEKKDTSTTTTVTGMVVSVEGTVVTLQQFDRNAMGGGKGNAQQRPDGDFPRPEGDFTMPEGGFARPEGDFTMPEGDFTMPEGGFARPEGDFTMPEGERPNFGNFGGNQGETTTVDLKNAHISIQDGDIKAAGTISDIKAGSFLTITLDGNGEATEVLVGSMGGFGGRGQGGVNGTGFGGGKWPGGKSNRGNKKPQSDGQST